MAAPCYCITTPCDCAAAPAGDLGQVAAASRWLAWGVAALFLYYAFIKRR